MTVPALKTRRPSGKPPHPMLLIAGVEKAGKSYSGAAFSASDLIDRTFWIEIGEGAADQYGAIPGARYEIVEHDGTYAGISHAVWAATQQPREDGRPHAMVIDSITEFWDLLADEAQMKANARAAAKAAKANRPPPAEDVQITMDLWNDAKKRWRRVLETLRTYDGPVVLLARLELVTVMGGDGKPTTDREWKIRAEKNLPYECDAIVKMTAPQTASLTGVRSTVLQVPPGRDMPMPQFTIDGLLRRMGLDGEGATAPRAYIAPRAVLDEVPDAPMDRQQPRADDEWNTATGQQLPPPAPGMPSVTGDEINEIVRLLGVKRGVYNGQCAGVVSQLVRRRVDDPRTLSQSEARSIIETLTAEPEPAPTGPPVGTPDNPGITDPQMKMIQAVFKEKGITGAQEKRDYAGRMLGLDGPVKSVGGLSQGQASQLLDAMRTGEIPTPAGPNANGEGISEFDVLDQMILDVHDQQSQMDTEDAIGAELNRGTITESDAELLRERLAGHVKHAKAGASA